MSNLNFEIDPDCIGKMPSIEMGGHLNCDGCGESMYDGTDVGYHDGDQDGSNDLCVTCTIKITGVNPHG